MRSNFFSYENYKLETVAREELGVGKDIGDSGLNKLSEIQRRFKEDKLSLAKYNILDCLLVSQIYEKTKLVEMILTRSQISGLLMDKVGLSTGAFDHFLLPHLHRRGFVANNVPDSLIRDHAAGGYVMDPISGVYKNVVLLDFTSLYPSIIKTFKIDPYSRIKNDVDTLASPSGLSFSGTEHILPDFIDQLLDLRKKAKRDGDAPLSHAIKILMNSFYGVMGSSGSRFYHADLPSAITESGQWILKKTIQFFEDNGYSVLYGDTDSVFVQLKGSDYKFPEEKGRELSQSLTEYLAEKIFKDFKTESYLFMEFEKYYKNFFLPRSRSNGKGAKKRYVGIVAANGKEELKFSGMEFVRSDWTKAAKSFQFELYRRLFSSEPLDEFIQNFIKDIRNKKYDSELIYTKRLTKPASEYQKSIPPHVKAALCLPPEKLESKRRISYVMTRRGPVPIELDHSDIDYHHYIEKQIRPIADDVLYLEDKSFDDIVSGDQLKLF